ncbi:MAG: ferrochelatase, partial [Actinobacteria bacterium]|nr:ferrochelatase [Actinomycetota bacterium]
HYEPPTGVLLIQLGTPDSTKTSDVRRYLREFLGDPRVLDLSAPARALLLNAVILPFRPRRSAEAYQKIWTEEGSPLIRHTEALAAKMQELLGDGFRVAYGMRYQNPPLHDAIEHLVAAGCARIVLLPLFPQYASASTGSAVQHALELIGRRHAVPDVTTINRFYDAPGFIDAAAGIAKRAFEAFRPDHVLFSYHGLPEKQIRKADPSGGWCLQAEGCCERITPANRSCYRAQSFSTTRKLAEALGLEEGSYSTAFQSRLAGQKWIEPYTDKELPKLHDLGVRRLAVLTPSFAADCLETLEEIGIRARCQWAKLGGEDMLLVPCVNADSAWAAAAADMIRAAL